MPKGAAEQRPRHAERERPWAEGSRERISSENSETVAAEPQHSERTAGEPQRLECVCVAGASLRLRLSGGIREKRRHGISRKGSAGRARVSSGLPAVQRRLIHCEPAVTFRSTAPEPPFLP